MPVAVVDDRGIRIVISDAEARQMAERLIGTIERALRQDELSTSDQWAVAADYQEAERLLEEIGELDHKSAELAIYRTPDELAAEAEQQRAFSRRTIESLAQMTQRLDDDDETVPPAEQPDDDEVESERKDVVGVRRDRDTNRYIVYGRGAEVSFKTYEQADRAARDRLGWR